MRRITSSLTAAACRDFASGVNVLDMATGEPIWKHNIGGDTFNYLLGAPVRVYDELCFLGQQVDIIALDATDGSFLWQLETGVTGAKS